MTDTRWRNERLSSLELEIEEPVSSLEIEEKTLPGGTDRRRNTPGVPDLGRTRDENKVRDRMKRRLQRTGCEIDT